MTMQEINAVDLAFVVDTTGSMGTLIEAAKRQMVQMMEELVRAAQIDLRLGIIEYRDHPPQDTLVYRVYKFTGNLKQAQKTIEGLSASGGGDGPESVLDGIWAACYELEWRRHARRLAVLVGDAPPHGVGGAGDGFRNGCPCGEDIDSVTRAAEETCVTVHALGLTAQVTESFGKISQLTGGQFFPVGKAETAIQHLAEILKQEFGKLELDKRVLAAWQSDPEASTETLATELGCTRHEVSDSLVRLLSRDLIEIAVPAVEEAAVLQG